MASRVAQRDAQQPAIALEHRGRSQGGQSRQVEQQPQEPRAAQVSLLAARQAEELETWLQAEQPELRAW